MKLIRSAAIRLTIAACAFSMGLDAQFPVRGGSHYVWYTYNPSQCSLFNNSCRDPYSAIANYDVQYGTIRNHLAQMYNGGQRRLGIDIYHQRGGADCSSSRSTNLNSSGGNLSPQCRSNLQNLLTDVRNAGFFEVEVTFHPQAYNNPFWELQKWPKDWRYNPYFEGLYQENWNLIVNLRPIFQAAGLNIKVDLFNEATPPPIDDPATYEWWGIYQYCQRLWGDYTFVFGKGDTFGFSIIGDPWRLQSLDGVYGSNQPDLFKIHFYENAEANYWAVCNELASQGKTQGWIIGEAFYNDSSEAAALKLSYDRCRNLYPYHTVYFLLQFPVNSSYQMQVPLSYGSYIAQGW